MLQNYNTYRILQEFFDNPRKDFHIREISRKLILAQISVINHLKFLQGQGLVLKEKKDIYPIFRANRENERFKLLKQQNLVLRIYNSGLLTLIEKEAKPNCVILFGSASRGEDTEKSDVDLFVQADEIGNFPEKYEKALKRKINFVFEANLKNLTKELRNNIINGLVLYGYLKVF